VNGKLPAEVIQRIVLQSFGRLRLCYETGLRSNASLSGRVAVRFVIDRSGSVASSADAGSDLPDANVVSCVTRAFMGLSFPQPEGVVTVAYPLHFTPEGGSSSGARVAWSEPPRVEPYAGRFKVVMDHLGRGGADAALAEAEAWQKSAPGDVMALVALGEAYEAKRDAAQAARAYGSIVDLFSFRADSRRFAAERLERLGESSALALAADSYARAAAQRPDHPSSRRLQAFALVRKGEHERAFGALVDAMKQPYPAGRFPGVDRILREDLGLVAAAWKASQPARAREIDGRLGDAGGTPEAEPSLRFVLVWETDANDVDFHIRDGQGGHAYYGSKSLASGGELYADVTTGYGPECFTIRGPRARRAYPYKLEAHYFSRGPMGYGMGKLEIVEHDGKGNLAFEERPFVVMADRAYVDLGTVK
jgi:hypothetical protein